MTSEVHSKRQWTPIKLMRGDYGLPISFLFLGLISILIRVIQALEPFIITFIVNILISMFIIIGCINLWIASNNFDDNKKAWIVVAKLFAAIHLFSSVTNIGISSGEFYKNITDMRIACYKTESGIVQCEYIHSYEQLKGDGFSAHPEIAEGILTKYCNDVGKEWCDAKMSEKIRKEIASK